LAENWQRTTVISENMLRQFAGLPMDTNLTLHDTHSSYDYRGGWNSAWGLMKDMELITNKGGVYLFSTTQIDQWRDKLQVLEEQGVGDRTCEGFGQIQVCNEFHTVFREVAV
jgi:CRISPR-associated protein Csx10